MCGFSAMLTQKMEHKFLSIGRSQFIKEIVENCVHRGRNRLSGEIHLPGLLMTLFLSTVQFYTVTLKLERKKGLLNFFLESNKLLSYHPVLFSHSQSS